MVASLSARFLLCGLLLAALTDDVPAQPHSQSDAQPATGVSTSVASASPGARRLSPSILRTFAVFDRDKDGRLSSPEIARVLRDGKDAPRDLDGDGYVSAAEYVQSFLSLNTRPPVSPGHLVDRFLREGQALIQAGRVEEALKLYERITKQYPDWGLCWSSTGEALQLLNRLPEARSCYEQAVRIMHTNRPTGQEAVFRLAILEDLLGRPERFRSLLAQGKEALASEQRIFARSMYHDFARKVSEREVLNVMLHLEQQARSREAADLGQWAAVNLGRRPRLEAERLYTEGLVGDRAPVFAELDAAIARGRDEFWYLNVKARLLSRLGQTDQAVALHRQSLKLASRPHELFMSRFGLFSCLSKQGRSQEAGVIAEALMVSPPAGKPRQRLIAMFFQTGRNDLAKKLQSRAPATAATAPAVAPR